MFHIVTGNVQRNNHTKLVLTHFKYNLYSKKKYDVLTAHNFLLLSLTKNGYPYYILEVWVIRKETEIH